MTAFSIFSPVSISMCFFVGKTTNSNISIFVFGYFKYLLYLQQWPGWNVYSKQETVSLIGIFSSCRSKNWCCQPQNRAGVGKFALSFFPGHRFAYCFVWAKNDYNQKKMFHLTSVFQEADEDFRLSIMRDRKVLKINSSCSGLFAKSVACFRKRTVRLQSINILQNTAKISEFSPLLEGYFRNGIFDSLTLSCLQERPRFRRGISQRIIDRMTTLLSRFSFKYIELIKVSFSIV